MDLNDPNCSSIPLPVEEPSVRKTKSERLPSDTIFVDVRREAFALDKTGPPAFAGSDDEDADDGARE